MQIKLEILDFQNLTNGFTQRDLDALVKEANSTHIPNLNRIIELLKENTVHSNLNAYGMMEAARLATLPTAAGYADCMYSFGYCDDVTACVISGYAKHISRLKKALGAALGFGETGTYSLEQRETALEAALRTAERLKANLQTLQFIQPTH